MGLVGHRASHGARGCLWIWCAEDRADHRRAPSTGRDHGAHVRGVDAADGDQYAAPQLAQARAALERAQAAMARGREDEARSAALAATADADLAQVLSRAAVTRAEFSQQQLQIADLRSRLQMDAAEGVQNPLDSLPATAPAAQRLQLLDADTRLNPFAQYERMQARQALATVQAASNCRAPLLQPTSMLMAAAGCGSPIRMSAGPSK